MESKPKHAKSMDAPTGVSGLCGYVCVRMVWPPLEVSGSCQCRLT